MNTYIRCCSNGHGHSHHLPVIMDEKDDFVISSLRGLLIVLGLSVHELFEGLAIGLESSASYVWYVWFLLNDKTKFNYKTEQDRDIKISNVIWNFRKKFLNNI